MGRGVFPGVFAKMVIGAALDDQLPGIWRGRTKLAASFTGRALWGDLSPKFCRRGHFWRQNPSSGQLRHEPWQHRVGPLGLAIAPIGVRFCREVLSSATPWFLAGGFAQGQRMTEAVQVRAR